ncbi:SseB family protein [Actinomadura hibisca]|uniref:SseB family protein n=1 Tax=Actinomadura hibisca TaxID=68565 RepID=UPI000835F1FF|nr:SseB family protein [Actinomadura hibisca]
MDWNDFAERLAVELMRLPVRSFLIVQGAGGLPYVQAMRSPGFLDAEAVGSEFLPRPLNGRQQRRLAALGWHEPDEEQRHNWWDRISMPVSADRASDAQTEACGRLAARMAGAFRDVYGTGSPLELVYQAGRTSGGGLALPALGIPVAIPEAEQHAASGADLEASLTAARERGDQREYLQLLARTTLCLPSPGAPGADGTPAYATAMFGDGTFVLAFTSPEAMEQSLRGQAVHHRPASLLDLARTWPNAEWRLAVNPGLPSGAYLDSDLLLGYLADQTPANGSVGAHARPAAPEPESKPEPAGAVASPERPAVARPPRRTVQRPAQRRPAARTPQAAPKAPAPAQRRPDAVAPSATQKPSAIDAVVMQKVVRPEHVPHYLDGGYDRVAGYVHRAQDVAELTTPEQLVRVLGLVYEGSPFSPADEALHVIRWPALKPALFRTPLGGIDEWSMEIIPGGWVIEKAPFPGSGYAPGEGPSIPEFKINSQRLPHGSGLYRVDRAGAVSLVAEYDADLRRWRIRLPRAEGRG